MSKRSYLQDRLSSLPEFVFSFIEHYYDGDSVNTQIAYSIDIKTFLVFLQRYKFPEIANLENFTPVHMEAVTAEDLLNFRAYLKEYEVTTQNAAGNPPLGSTGSFRASGACFYIYIRRTRSRKTSRTRWT